MINHKKSPIPSFNRTQLPMKLRCQNNDTSKIDIVTSKTKLIGMDPLSVNEVLISAWDKTGLVSFLRDLTDLDGSLPTFKLFSEEKDAPILNMNGIVADPYPRLDDFKKLVSNPALEKFSGRFFEPTELDLVRVLVVNLFGKSQLFHQDDVSLGRALIKEALKGDVLVVVDFEDYNDVLEATRTGELNQAYFRERLAVKAKDHLQEYDLLAYQHFCNCVLPHAHA